RHDCWLFHAQTRSNFRLRKRVRRNGEMHERAPFGLAQTHGFETLIQLLPPCTCGTVEQLAKCLVFGHNADQLVSILTNSGFRVCQSSFAVSLKEKLRLGGAKTQRSSDLSRHQIKQSVLELSVTPRSPEPTVVFEGFP